MTNARIHCAIEPVERRILLSAATAISSVIKSIPGTAGPWAFTANVNSAYRYGVGDQSAPVVIDGADGISLTPGTSLSFLYLNGRVTAGRVWPRVDANGDTAAHSNNNKGSSHRVFPSYYFNHSDYPANLTALVGTFATSSGVIVGKPFLVGDARTVAVPKGAQQLQLGTNDDIFADNSGSWTVDVREVPTLASVTAIVGTQARTSTDNGTAISATNVVAFPQSSAPITLIADAVSTSDPDVLDDVRWAVQENQADRTTVAKPSSLLAPSPSSPTDPLKQQFATNQPGSFNITCYFDANDNHKLDSGEALKVLHVAVVGIAVRTAVVHVASVFSAASASVRLFGSATRYAGTRIASGDFTNHPAISFLATATLTGGGPTGAIGVSAIHLGWLQNGTADTFAATYSDHHVEIEVVAPARFPILDSGRPSAGTGGDTAFLTESREVVGGAGAARTITALDSPAVDFTNIFPATSAPAAKTDGTNDFTASLAAYSDDFNAAYSGAALVKWSARFKYGSFNGRWLNSGSVVSYNSLPVPTPTDLAALGMVSRPPTFTSSAQNVAI